MLTFDIKFTFRQNLKIQPIAVSVWHSKVLDVAKLRDVLTWRTTSVKSLSRRQLRVTPTESVIDAAATVYRFFTGEKWNVKSKLSAAKSRLHACKLPLKPRPEMLRRHTHARATCFSSASCQHSPSSNKESQPVYNLSSRNVSSVAESVTKFGSVSICRPSKSRGSRPSLSTSSDGKRSESKLSGMPTIALPMSLTKSWRDSVSSAPETSIQVVDDTYIHEVPFITAKVLTLTPECGEMAKASKSPSHAMGAMFSPTNSNSWGQPCWSIPTSPSTVPAGGQPLLPVSSLGPRGKSLSERVSE